MTRHLAPGTALAIGWILGCAAIICTEHGYPIAALPIMAVAITLIVLLSSNRRPRTDITVQGNVVGTEAMREHITRIVRQERRHDG